MHHQQAREGKGARHRAFTVLGIEASATADEIKSAFRKKAIEVHPDRNPNDPFANEKFRAVHDAYEFLRESCIRGNDAGMPGYGKNSQTSSFDLKDLLKKMVESSRWNAVLSIAGGNPELSRYASQVMDLRVDDIIGSGREEVIRFLWENTESGESLDKCLDIYLRLGDIDTAREIICNAVSRGRWDWIADCAQIEGFELKGYSLSALEQNAEKIAGSDQEHAMFVLFRISGSRKIRDQMMGGLLGRGSSLGLKLVWEELEKRREWKSITCAAMDLGPQFPELKAYAIAILERNLQEVLKGADANPLCFLGEGTQNAATRKKVIVRLERMGDIRGIKRILDSVARLRGWDELTGFAESYGRRHPLIMKGVLEHLGGSLDGMLRAGKRDAVLFLWKNTQEKDGRARILERSCLFDEHAAARSILDEMGRQGQWGSILKAAGAVFGKTPELREYSLGILCRNMTDVLRGADTRPFLCLLEEQGMFERMGEAAGYLHRKDRSQFGYCMMLLEGSIMEIARERKFEILLLLWDHALHEQSRYVIAGCISNEGDARTARALFRRISRAEEWTWLEHCQRMASGRADLSAYISDLLERRETGSRGKRQKQIPKRGKRISGLHRMVFGLGYVASTPVALGKSIKGLFSKDTVMRT